MGISPKAKAEFLNQERVDNAVKTSMALDSDDMDFLKTHADTFGLSVELIFSNGAWWLPKTPATGHLLDAVLTYRRNNSGYGNST